MISYGNSVAGLIDSVAHCAMGYAQDQNEHTSRRLTEAKDKLRQHIEQGEPDCRTCYFFWAGEENPVCHLAAPCINFSQYKRADYTPLCEVTHEQ